MNSVPHEANDIRWMEYVGGPACGVMRKIERAIPKIWYPASEEIVAVYTLRRRQGFIDAKIDPKRGVVALYDHTGWK